MPSMTRLLVTLALAALVLPGCSTMPGEVRAIAEAPNVQRPTVTTAEGPLTGIASARMQVFLGVPFAAAPVGALRFRPPQPVVAWTRPRDASRIGPACPQSFSVGTWSEDCLTLNVYAPRQADPAVPLPVMVWLYGGGLSLGSNAQYDPTVLAEKQRVIVVVPNYRLGAVGFLAHPALRGEGEGNYGILDQQAALRWVNRNIAHFGGDPARVTLFGESAGALSTCVQLALPGSRGLFQQAILQSDTCVFPDQATSMADAERGGVAMAHALGCTDPASALECLRTVPIKTLIRAKSQRRGNAGKDSWSPMFGGEVLPDTPRAMLARGAGADVAVLAGSNHDEGHLFSNLFAWTLSFTSRNRYEKAVARTVPERSVAAVLAEYDNTARRSRSTAFADILTDSHFACPISTLHTTLGGRAPFYAYEFNDPHAPSRMLRAPLTAPMGAYHASEILYVFQTSWALAHVESLGPAQKALSDRIQDHWGQFARTGAPSINEQAWPVFDGQAPLRLAVGQESEAEFATRHRCAFWHAQGY